MRFSIALIAKDEEKTLPRLLESLAAFRERGGEVVILDTGSTDRTVEIARAAGCRLEEAGDLYVRIITEEQARLINGPVVGRQEAKVVSAGDRVFDFGAAMNRAAELASNDWVVMPDADCVLEMDLDAMEVVGAFGHASVLNHRFVMGNLEYRHTRVYDRRRVRWTGMTHECLVGDVKILELPPAVFTMHHKQEHKDERGKRIPGMALQLFLDPENPRHLHYYGRELAWSGRHRAAIEVLTKHVQQKDVWKTEQSKSLIIIGDSRLALGEDDKALAAWFEAFHIESRRREPLLRIAAYHRRKENAAVVAAYAAAALTIPDADPYIHEPRDYRELPHQYLYWALWQMGHKEEAKRHFELACAFAPDDPVHATDKAFFEEVK